MDILDIQSQDVLVTLNRYVSYEYKKLPVRILNVIREYLGTDNSGNAILKLIISNYDDLILENKIGVKSAEHLMIFFNKIDSFYKKLLVIDSNTLTIEHTRQIALELNPSIVIEDTDFINLAIDDKGKIKLFYLLESLISKNFVFKNDINKKYIFIDTYTNRDVDKKNNFLSNLEIGDEMKRLIRNELSKNMINVFGFINKTRRGYNREYIDFMNIPSLVLDSEFASKINNDECTFFNLYFFSEIFDILLMDTHELIASPIMPKTRKRIDGRIEFIYPCFIRKDLNRIYNFEGLIEKLRHLSFEQISKDRKIPLDVLIREFINDRSFEKNSDLLEACKLIIRKGTNFETDSQDNVILKTNVKNPKLTEYIIEALNYFNTPTNDNDITEFIQSRYPEIKTIQQKIRIQILRDKDNFIALGKTGLYALKNWESEKKNVHKGTIRDIIEDYLKEENEPKHLYEITKHVKRYKETSEKNVRTNIESDDKKRFQHIPGSFYGLFGKNYENLSKYKQIRSQGFRKSVLKKWNGRNFEEFINYYKTKYDYLEIQIIGIIENMKERKELSISIDGKIILH